MLDARGLGDSALEIALSAIDRLLSSTEARENVSEVVRETVNDGDGEECEQEGERLSADDDAGRRLVEASSNTRRKHEGEHAGDERDGRHQDRTEAISVGLNERIEPVSAEAPEVIGVVHLENTVLLHDPEEHQKSEHGEHVDALAEDLEAHEREGNGQRK